MRNLAECINLFDWSERYNKSLAVRQMENLSEWDTAAHYWDLLGQKEDADACRMIANAIHKGDEFRSRLQN